MLQCRQPPGSRRRLRRRRPAGGQRPTAGGSTAQAEANVRVQGSENDGRSKPCRMHSMRYGPMPSMLRRALSAAWHSERCAISRPGEICLAAWRPDAAGVPADGLPGGRSGANANMRPFPAHRRPVPGPCAGAGGPERVPRRARATAVRSAARNAGGRPIHANRNELLN